jgi:hypothetical protein
MPILTQPDPHPKRHRLRLWVLLGVPGVILALLAGLVAWSWMQERVVTVGSHRFWYGRTKAFGNGRPATGHTVWSRSPSGDEGMLLLSIPDYLGGGYYGVSWTYVL